MADWLGVSSQRLGFRGVRWRPIARSSEIASCFTVSQRRAVKMETVGPKGFV